jgi:hypothetical protein
MIREPADFLFLFNASEPLDQPEGNISLLVYPIIPTTITMRDIVTLWGHDQQKLAPIRQSETFTDGLPDVFTKTDLHHAVLATKRPTQGGFLQQHNYLVINTLSTQ